MTTKHYAPSDELLASEAQKSAFWWRSVAWFGVGLLVASRYQENGLIVGAAFALSAFAWNALHIILHELGHFAAARLLGLRVPRVRIGRGRKLFAFNFQDTEFELNRYLTLGGLTITKDRNLKGFFRRSFIATASGPVVDALLLIALLFYLFSPEAPHNGESWSRSFHLLPFCFVLIQGSSLIYGLLPWPSTRTIETTSGSATSSDGHQLLTILFNPSHRHAVRKSVLELQDIQNGFGTGEAIPDFVFDARQALSAAFVMSAQYVEAGEMELAVSALEWILGQDKLLQAERILVYDQLASLPTLSSAGWGYRQRALYEWLPEAERLCPAKPITLEVTRGILLVLNQSLEEGEAILRRHHDSAVREHDRFGCKLYLAVSAAWKGDKANADTWLKAAKEINSRSTTICTAEAYIQDPPHLNTDRESGQNVEPINT